MLFETNCSHREGWSQGPCHVCGNTDFTGGDLVLYMNLKRLKFNYVHVYMYVTLQWYKVVHNDLSAGLRKTSSFTCIHRKSSESPKAVIE